MDQISSVVVATIDDELEFKGVEINSTSGSVYFVTVQLLAYGISLINMQQED